MVTTTPSSPERAETAVTPWVLVVAADEVKARSTRKMWEAAGFAVEVASSIEDAMVCLAVMTPALIVVDDMQYRPTPR